jgi:hypothetical protein
LIPLFAVGAFLAFTLSQLGMVVHWRRHGGRRALRSLVLNALGATATGSTLVIIAVSKFLEGAWITLLLIPLIMLVFVRVRRYHERLDRETEGGGRLQVEGLVEPLVLIPLKRFNRVARKALRLGLALSREVQAVQVLVEECEQENLTRLWPALVEQPARAAGLPPPKLVIVPSPYREFFGPLVAYILRFAAEHPDRCITVVIPEVVERRWYHFLFPHRTTLLRDLLLLRCGPEIMIITAPWFV